MTRRRKHWGWGFEDQQPPHEQVEAAAAGARAHLGLPPAEVERPVPLDSIELAPARLDPPDSLAHICATDRYARVTHSYGKSYRDVVRAFRGRFDNPTDVVVRPADDADLERVLAWCEEAGAWLIAPAATCRLDARMAIITSVAVRLWLATRAGSSQTRIE